MNAFETTPVEDTRPIKGIPFPAHITFRQLLITGPPGAGKSTLIRKLGGWSEEGYIDLSMDRWWMAQSLSLRPREIHLGFPFKSHKDALTVFEKAWLESIASFELDFDRIWIPPEKGNFFSIDWRKRYVFEFHLPPVELLFERRLQRAKRGTHPVDADLEQTMISKQVSIYQQAALYLHKKGLHIYIREDIGKPPLKIITPESQTMVLQSLKPDKSLLKRLKDSFSGLTHCEELDLKHAYHLEHNKIRLPLNNHPIQLNIGSEKSVLHIYPERLINDIQQDTPVERYIIFNPKTYYKEITGYLRLNSGDQLTIGRNEDQQKNFFDLKQDFAQRQLSITNEKGCLVFKNLDDRHSSCISPLIKSKDLNRVNRWRFAKLKRLFNIFGGPINALAADDALDLIAEVNTTLENEVYRPKDNSGNPGGIIALPSDSIPFLVGDLHTKADNLLLILSQNGFLESLKKGRASLIILGDAVHSEEEGQLEEMQSSMLIMDLIFKLKLRFPEHVFYLRGNHDSFSEELGKRGVPQGLLWEKALIKSRGKRYRDEMQRFYNLLPYIAYSDHFIACHAAPPTSKVSFSDLVNIRSKPGLINELINTRMRKPNKPSGYYKREIKLFRKCMEVGPDTPVIVGHTPMTNNETIWESAGGIDNHHVVYGSDNDWMGVITKIGNRMYPLRYPTESLIPLINTLST